MTRNRNRTGGNSLKIDLIRQALVAAERFTHLANLLLEEYGDHNPSSRNDGNRNGGEGRENNREMDRNSSPGNNGVVKGLFVQLDNGQRIDLPHDYIVQSQVVFGDRIKVINEPGQGPQFKFIERVRRERINALLVQKDGSLVAIADTGSYDVLPEALEAFGAREGDKIVILLPKGDYRVPFAAVAAKIGSAPSAAVSRSETDKPTNVPEVKKTSLKPILEVNPVIDSFETDKVVPAPGSSSATLAEIEPIPVATVPAPKAEEVIVPPAIASQITIPVSSSPAQVGTTSTQSGLGDLASQKTLEDDDLR